MEALDAITRHLGVGSYVQWDESTKQAWLLTELHGKRPLLPRNVSLAALGFDDTVKVRHRRRPSLPSLCHFSVRVLIACLFFFHEDWCALYRFWPFLAQHFCCSLSHDCLLLCFVVSCSGAAHLKIVRTFTLDACGLWSNLVSEDTALTVETRIATIAKVARA